MEHLTMSMFAKKEDLYKAQRDQLIQQKEKLRTALIKIHDDSYNRDMIVDVAWIALSTTK